MADFQPLKTVFRRIRESAPPDENTVFNLEAADLLLELAGEVDTSKPTGAAAANSLVGKAVRIVNEIRPPAPPESAGDEERRLFFEEINTPLVVPSPEEQLEMVANGLAVSGPIVPPDAAGELDRLRELNEDQADAE